MTAFARDLYGLRSITILNIAALRTRSRDVHGGHIHEGTSTRSTSRVQRIIQFARARHDTISSRNVYELCGEVCLLLILRVSYLWNTSDPFAPPGTFDNQRLVSSCHLCGEHAIDVLASTKC